MGSSGAVSATAPFPWSRERSPAPAGRARGSSASGSGSWTLTQARERAMARADLARTGSTIGCAIYTRKSSDEGLEQEFNSLDAQREACEAYIVSQRYAGWVALADMYDDGGLSGGTMERPALKRLLEDIKASKAHTVVVYKIPWGVDSDQFWGQTEVANPLNLEATNASRSPLRRTDRYPNQSWRNFRLIGTQPFNLADHVAVAGRRREDVEAQRLGWGHRCAAVALFGAQAEGVRADGAILPDHRHSRGGTGWLLDSSGAAERGNRELRCRCGLDCDVTPPAAGQDRQDRRRGFGARATGVQTRRTACLPQGQGADA